MASIQTAIVLADRMSAPLMKINQNLTKVTTSSEALGRRSEEAFDRVRKGAGGAVPQQEQLNQKMQQGINSANGLGHSIKSLVAGYISIRAAVSGIKSVIEATDQQQIAETKLATVMRQRMGATDQDINKMKEFTAAQQKVGVVGDEVQMAGAQQLATFLNSNSALQKLIPAMNNLAVQQNGVAATSEDLTGIGNLMGKVMQGQTSALTRVGVTFNAAQEQVLKYGNEQERAATLAQVITDNVGEMNTVMAKTPQGAIQQVKNNFGDMKEVIGAQLTPVLLYLFNTIQEHMPEIEAIGNAFAFAMGIAITAISWVIDVVANAVAFVQENWAIIGPILGAVAAAIIAISVATKIATAVQYIMNGALYACPLVWIILLIVGIIAAIYLVVGAINKATGSTISATGVIAGTIAALGAFIGNIFMAAINLVIDIFGVLWNFVAMFANFFGNIFNDPIGSIVHLFFDMVDIILSLLQTLASAIDFIFGSNLADGVQGWRDDLGGWVDDKFGEQDEVMEKVDTTQYHFERFNYDEAFDAGYEVGEGIDDAISNLDPSSLIPDDDISDKAGASTNSAIADNTAQTAANTAAIKDSLDITSDQLSYLKDYATQQAINRYSQSSIKVEMTNNNAINSSEDIDSITTRLKRKLEQELASSAEGVMI